MQRVFCAISSVLGQRPRSTVPCPTMASRWLCQQSSDEGDIKPEDVPAVEKKEQEEVRTTIMRTVMVRSSGGGGKRKWMRPPIESGKPAKPPRPTPEERAAQIATAAATAAAAAAAAVAVKAPMPSSTPSPSTSAAAVPTPGQRPPCTHPAVATTTPRPSRTSSLLRGTPATAVANPAPGTPFLQRLPSPEEPSSSMKRFPPKGRNSFGKSASSADGALAPATKDGPRSDGPRSEGPRSPGKGASPEQT